MDNDQPATSEQIFQAVLSQTGLTDGLKFLHEAHRLELDRAKLETEKAKLQSEAARPSFDAVIRFAELAIRSLLLLSGGAAVALLSFAGNRGATGKESLDAYAWAVMLFGGSASGSVLTAGLSYLGQSCFTADHDKLGTLLRWIAIITWLGSLSAFGVGVKAASNAVSLSRYTFNTPGEVGTANPTNLSGKK